MQLSKALTQFFGNLAGNDRDRPRGWRVQREPLGRATPGEPLAEREQSRGRDAVPFKVKQDATKRDARRPPGLARGATLAAARADRTTARGSAARAGRPGRRIGDVPGLDAVERRGRRRAGHVAATSGTAHTASPATQTSR